MRIAKPASCPVQEKFAGARRGLSAALTRDDEIDLVLTALVAQEHLLLVGPPGCAKSLLLDAAMGWMPGGKFTVLLTKFSTPVARIIQTPRRKAAGWGLPAHMPRNCGRSLTRSTLPPYPHLG